MKPEQMKKDEEDFAAGFEDAAEPKSAMTDEEAFDAPAAPEQPSDEGTPSAEPAPEAPAAEPETPAVEQPMTEEPAETPVADAGQEAPAGEPAVAVVVSAQPEGEEEALSPEDEQRKRSWEGRLRKREEELAAREAALKAGNAAEEAVEGETQGEDVQNAIDLESPAEDAGEVAEEGEPDYEAMASEDFGPDFVKMIGAVIGKKVAAEIPGIIEQAVAQAVEKADGRIGGIESTLNEAIAALNDMHQGEIADEHADFSEVISSPQFETWKASLPAEQQAKVDKVCAGGSARQCIKLLNDFKASLAPASEAPAPQSDDGVTEDELEAAEGVRSSGLKLPKPITGKGTEGFEDAWSELPD